LTTLTLIAVKVSDLEPLRGLTGMRAITMSFSLVSDISPLENMTALTYAALSNNQIVDIGALVMNSGIGADDQVDVRSNPIDCASAASDITSLEARGVRLQTDCP
jgi:Leucine-rich repeat (LRR) protein